MDLIETWDVVYKWILLFGITLPALYFFMSIDIPEDEEYLDVPDFIKGDDKDFYGN